MIERIIEYSIRNPLLVILVACIVAGAGVWAVVHTPIDAIPDLSENQVIVFADWPGRSPQEVEDQVTYPLSSNLQGLAGVKAVRATSEFGFSMVNIIFEDNIGFYFARERVLEKLSIATTFLPAGVVPYLAPDATALGQIFWYTVEGGGLDAGRLRAIQDWYVRYQLQSVAGVAEVASVGGFPIEYQIDVDPNKLRAYGVTLGEVFTAVGKSNSSVGGRIVQKSNSEYLVRSLGWITSLDDVRKIVIKSQAGTPVYVDSVASVQFGSAMRRASLEKNGNEAVGGVVLMRYGENPLEVTQRIKEKIDQLAPGLPPGVRIVPFYDRTALIERAIHTVTGTLREEMIVASIVILLVLWHVRSAIVVCITLPLAVLIAFIFMRFAGVPSNIMSLSGIAISIGVLVDSSIVMVENATHHLYEHFGNNKIAGDTRPIVLPAVRMVGRPIFFAVMIMVISFIPVFALSGIEGRMFHPLAWTKTFAMVGVSILAITLVPALIPIFIRGRLHSEQDSWLVRSVIEVYKPVLRYLLDHAWPIVLVTGLVFVVGFALAGWSLFGIQEFFFLLFFAVSLVGCVWAAYVDQPGVGRWVRMFGSLSLLLVVALFADGQMKKVGGEFMPPLNEGTILDMPVTIPRASITEVADDLKTRDAMLRSFPEVSLVVGKAGRAETPTDPAPPDMIETVVNLRPHELWPKRSLRYADARRQTDEILAAIEQRGWWTTLTDSQRTELAETATMHALDGFDREMRNMALEDYTSFEQDLAKQFGEGKASDSSTAQRDELWSANVHEFNWKLFDSAVPAYTWLAIEGLRDKAAEWKLGGENVSHPDWLTLATEMQAPFGKRLFLWQKTKDELLKEMNTVVSLPGWGNIWTQPIINRVDMLATGVRTMIGVKVYGSDLDEIQRISDQIAEVLKKVRGAADVVPDQSIGEGYLEITIDRERAARFGVNVGDVQDVIEVALGGKPVTTTVEGRERFPVRIRYARAFREDEESVRNLLVSVAAPMKLASAMGEEAAVAEPNGGQPVDKKATTTGMAAQSTSPTNPFPNDTTQIPLGQIADVRIVKGPSMIKSENGLLRAYVQLNVRDRDVVGFVEEAQAAVKKAVKLPAGMYLEWSGQFEHQVRAKRTLTVILPIVFVTIFLLLYVTYNDIVDATLMMLAVPGAVAGGVLFQYLFGFNFSVAVWVGFIACFGLATQTGVVMLIYLREAVESRGGLEKLSLAGLKQAVLDGAVHRLRPKLLTEGTIIIGLAPMLWATGTGSEIMRPMAAPVLGGILVADEVIDLLLPVLFYHVRAWRWRRLHPEAEEAQAENWHSIAQPVVRATA